MAFSLAPRRFLVSAMLLAVCGCGGGRSGAGAQSSDGAVDATDSAVPPPSAAEDIAAVLAACAPAESGRSGLLEPWPANGPGTVEPVPIAHPRTAEIVYVLAGAGAGALHASVDGAASFCPLPAPALDWVVIAPSDPRVLFGGVGDRLHTSTNAGRTWVDLGPVIPRLNLDGTGVRVHPGRADVIFTAPRLDQTAILVEGGVVTFERSRDGGHSWTPVRINMLPFLIHEVQLAVGPGAPGVLYLLVHADPFPGTGPPLHLFVSRDDGATWAGQPMPTDETAMLVVASDGRLLLTADGLWTSDDGGKNWQAATPPPGLREPRVFAPAGAAPGTFHVTGFRARSDQFMMFKTVNAGAAWTEISLPEGVGEVLKTPSFSGDAIYLSSRAGVFRTRDDGARWDLRWMDVHGSLAASVDGRVLSSTVPGAVFFSSNGGELWSARPTAIRGVSGAIGPGQPPAFYVVAEGFPGQHLLRRSTDGGVTWAETAGFTRISAVTAGGDGTLFWADASIDSGGRGVFRSDDQGGNSTQVLSENVAALALAADDRRLYASWQNAGTCRDLGPRLCVIDILFVSDDRGATWRTTSVIAQDPGSPQPQSGAITALVTHRTDPATVAVAVTGLGLFVSHDAGSTFKPLVLPMLAPAELTGALLAVSGDLLFVAPAPSPSSTVALLAGPLSGPGQWKAIAPSTLPPVHSLVRGPAGSLWVTTESGLYRYRP
jgi:photosystem II stability/assembly factor-like uncharacterized protein